MKSLILHIGSHKTGSTTIQSFLRNNSRLIDGYGWKLFCLKKNGLKSGEGNVNSWINFMGERENFEAKLDLDLVKELGRMDGNAIISSEELSWVFDESHIEEIAIALRNVFDDIKIVVYFRRQDDAIVSHYQQGFKRKNSTAARFYGRSLEPAPPIVAGYHDKYLDYNNKYLMWASAFGKANVLVRWFQRESLVESDVLVDFLTLIGIDVLDIDLPKKDNQSLSKYSIIVNLTLFNGYHYSDWWREFIKYLDVNYEKNFLPSRDYAERTYLRYEKSNQRLARELEVNIQTFSRDFSRYPIEADKINDSDYKVLVEAMMKFTDSLNILQVIMYKNKFFYDVATKVKRYLRS
jgi:hypothetical protein